MSTLDSTPIHKLELHYPQYGDWRCDGILEGGAPPTVGASVALTVGDLILRGRVLRSGLDAPDRPRFVVVGAPGWELPLAKPISYQSDVGVRLSTVLRDLSTLAGQAIELPSDFSIGDRFVSPASRNGETILLRDVLSALTRQRYLASWRVDPDGVTRFGARAGSVVNARATETSRDSAVGLIKIGLDSPASFLPGNLLGNDQIATLVVRDTAQKLTADIYTAKPSITTTILRKVAEFFPSIFYGYPRTYVVDAVRSDKRLDLLPPPDAQHLAELTNVEQWTMGGALLTPIRGALVTVHFRDANPTRPIVIGWGPGSTPTTTSIAGGGPAVARVGDHAGRLAWDSVGSQLYYSSGEGSAYALVAPSAGPPIPLFVGTSVAITTGSTKAVSG